MRAEPPPRLDLKLAATVTLAFLILISLGTWQVLRLQWKTELLHKIELLQAAPAKPLAEGLSRGDDADFIRVQLDCPGLDQAPTLKTYALNEAGQVGDRILAACPIHVDGYGSILIDRGFAPKGVALRPAASPDASVIGVLRKPAPPSAFAPKPMELAGRSRS